MSGPSTGVLWRTANAQSKHISQKMAQLVGTQAGEPVVPTYDWASFLRGHFWTVPQLKSYHHFIFTAAQPGMVVMKEFTDSVGKNYMMLADEEWVATHEELPLVMRVAGLSLSRQWYLYTQIREYCRHETEDLTCPKPSMEVEQEREESTSASAGGRAAAPPAKKVWRCGKCGVPGHTRKTCKSNDQEQ